MKLSSQRGCFLRIWLGSKRHQGGNSSNQYEPGLAKLGCDFAGGTLSVGNWELRSEVMSILWEKSEAWRWLVRRTRDSKRFFFAFATICGIVPGIIGYGVMQFTNSRNSELEAHLRKTARPESTVIIILSFSPLSPQSMPLPPPCFFV